MRCDDLEPLLTDFLEGDLPADVETEALEHVAGCRACDLYLAEYVETIELVAEWGGEALPTEVSQRMLAAVLNDLGINGSAPGTGS